MKTMKEIQTFVDNSDIEAKYIRCQRPDIDGLRFDVTPKSQGQAIEIAFGGFEPGEHTHGAPYKRIFDRTTGEYSYFRYNPGEVIVRRSQIGERGTNRFGNDTMLDAGGIVVMIEGSGDDAVLAAIGKLKEKYEAA